MFAKKTVRCPVCKETLGSLVPSQNCSYPCRECGWLFNFDGKGKELPPEKLNTRKSVKCGCSSCQDRDARARGEM